MEDYDMLENPYLETKEQREKRMQKALEHERSFNKPKMDSDIIKKRMDSDLFKSN